MLLEVRSWARGANPGLVELVTLLPVLDCLLDLLQPLLSRFQVPVQGQAGGLVQVGLNVHQVSAMLGLQAVFGMRLQTLGQIAGHLDDPDG